MLKQEAPSLALRSYTSPRTAMDYEGYTSTTSPRSSSANRRGYLSITLQLIPLLYTVF